MDKTTPHRATLPEGRKPIMNQTRINLIALKLRIVSQLADSLALTAESPSVRRALHLIADTTFDSAVDLSAPSRQDLRSVRPLSRS